VVGKFSNPLFYFIHYVGILPAGSQRYKRLTMYRMNILDFSALDAAALSQNPYPHIVIPNILQEEAHAAIMRDFPPIDFRGSLPLNELHYGESFRHLIAELEGPAFRKAIEQKFGIDLSGKPVFTTVRGRTTERDGHIHTDTKSKLITVLLYFNPDWTDEGGRLRILRNGQNLDDYAAEIPPSLGTCLIFRVTENCWHGHKPFTGVRRAIQLNYLADESALKQHRSRHNITAKWKNFKRRFLRKESY
jgi:SM-20-related protein